ncbi:hypothetical protein HJC23_009309 [Cyclotella cryptica]|uniref:Nucleotide-diphospho-sugar transferase domain-containing protein n=1 Tax=Cyclotella cryptica TaxID=29204 RepID=A0ABD3QSV3_9STRA
MMSAYSILLTIYMHSGLGQRTVLSDLPRAKNNFNRELTRPTTKIVAMTDISYAAVALNWHRRLIQLGYSNDEAIIVAADDATIEYFEKHLQIRVEPMLHPQSSGWPVANPDSRHQTRRRRIFASRWIYVLHQLKSGYSVLLTDADNIFVRYMNMSVLEDSEYDVFHAYCHNFPVNFLSMGFVICGGMMWLRGSIDGGVGKDGAALRYVESILKDCGWNGTDESTEMDVFEGAIHASKRIDPVPIRSQAAYCDDQSVINMKFFSNSLYYVWDNNTRPIDRFWKSEATGIAYATGHSFKIWDVDTAYRGPVEGYGKKQNDTANGEIIEKRCPNIDLNWVAMPYNTIGESKRLDEGESRMLRVKQWYEFCRNETLSNQTSYFDTS